MNVKPVTMRNTGDYFKMQSHMMNSVQFIREFVVNMIEAGASQGIIGFMFLAGHIKMILTDNGRGMNEQEMEDYLGELASSSSVIGLGEHHGIGAKVSAAFRNPLGVVYQSFTDPTDHKELGNMVTFGYDPSTEDWGLECEADESGRPVVVDYADLSKSEFKKLFISKTQTEVKTGTTILLRGSSPRGGHYFGSGRLRAGSDESQKRRSGWHLDTQCAYVEIFRISSELLSKSSPSRHRHSTPERGIQAVRGQPL